MAAPACERVVVPTTKRISDRRASAVVLEVPSAARRAGFLAAARRSRAFLRANARTPLTPAAYDAWLKEATTATRRRYFICRREGGELIGMATLSEIVRGAMHGAYLGYYRFEPWSGCGYMTAGIDLVLREAFRTLKLHRIEANIQPHNAPSRALVQRLGFRLEGFSPRYLKIAGRWRDHERWAILAEEWRAGLHSGRIGVDPGRAIGAG